MLRLVFLAALDQTIVATALPKIVQDIGGEKGYSWIGSVRHRPEREAQTLNTDAIACSRTSS